MDVCCTTLYWASACCRWQSNPEQRSPPAGREVVVPGAQWLAPTNFRNYDVSPHGNRFLMIKNADTEANAGLPELIVVQHWTEELKYFTPPVEPLDSVPIPVAEIASGRYAGPDAS